MTTKAICTRCRNCGEEFELTAKLQRFAFECDCEIHEVQEWYRVIFKPSQEYDAYICKSCYIAKRLAARANSND